MRLEHQHLDGQLGELEQGDIEVHLIRTSDMTRRKITFSNNIAYSFHLQDEPELVDQQGIPSPSFSVHD